MSLGVVKVSVGAAMLGCTLTLGGCADSPATPVATGGEVVPTQVTEPLSGGEPSESATGSPITEKTMTGAVQRVHKAVYSHPDVLDAGSSFETATNQIVTNVQLSNTAAADLLDELQSVADEQLSQTAGVPEGVTAVVRQHPGPIGGDD